MVVDPVPAASWADANRRSVAMDRCYCARRATSAGIGGPRGLREPSSRGPRGGLWCTHAGSVAARDRSAAGAPRRERVERPRALAGAGRSAAHRVGPIPGPPRCGASPGVRSVGVVDARASGDDRRRDRRRGGRGRHRARPATSSNEMPGSSRDVPPRSTTGSPGYLDEGRWPEGWEDDEVMVVRLAEAMERLRATGAQTIVAVSHGGVIYALERALGAEFQRVANLGGRWFHHDGSDAGNGDVAGDVAPGALGWLASGRTGAPARSRRGDDPRPAVMRVAVGPLGAVGAENGRSDDRSWRQKQPPLQAAPRPATPATSHGASSGVARGIARDAASASCARPRSSHQACSTSPRWVAGGAPSAGNLGPGSPATHSWPPGGRASRTVPTPRDRVSRRRPACPRPP